MSSDTDMVQTFIHCNMLRRPQEHQEGVETDPAQAGEGKDGVMLRQEERLSISIDMAPHKTA